MPQESRGKKKLRRMLSTLLGISSRMLNRSSNRVERRTKSKQIKEVRFAGTPIVIGDANKTLPEWSALGLGFVSDLTSGATGLVNAVVGVVKDAPKVQRYAKLDLKPDF
jgi:hypothetical protein